MPTHVPSSSEVPPSPLAPVLLVEDSPQDAEIAARIFRRARLANPIERLVDGREALDRLLDATLPDPALLMLDLHLPLFSGWDILERLKNSTPPPTMPIIVMVSSELDEDRLKDFAPLKVSSASKPVAIADLMARLELLASTHVLHFSAPTV